MNNSILNGYRVLDLTDETGMLCTGLLAGMGAEVIRLEKPGCRVSPATANAGKHHLTLDIETPSGRNIFRRLIKTADVLAKSYPPGYLASLGLGYDELKSQNPRLIMVSISPFGQTGPWRDYRSSDIVNCALGGPLSVCGEPDRPPLNPFGNQSFAAASLFAANGVLLAIFRRHASNQGQFIDISIHECLAATLDHVLVRYFYEGVRPEGRAAFTGTNPLIFSGVKTAISFYRYHINGKRWLSGWPRKTWPETWRTRGGEMKPNGKTTSTISSRFWENGRPRTPLMNYWKQAS